MRKLSRRQMLAFSAASMSAGALPGCVTPTVYPTEPVRGHAVDVHCHLFNARDLPVVRFLTEVVLRDHAPGNCTLALSKRAKTAFGPIEDPTLAERLIELVLRPLVKTAPTAVAELAALQAAPGMLAPSDDKSRTAQLVTRQIEGYLDATDGAKGLRVDSIDQRLRAQLLAEATAGRKGLKTTKLSDATASRWLLASEGPNGRLLNWIALFLRSRSSLAAELAQATRGNGFKPALLVPLMVDYAHWLGQDTDDESSFRDQMMVMGEIGRRASDASIHGMMAFDPLRAVFWKRGPHDGFDSDAFDPIALAREAMTRHGFLGLKVYPPMGFKATGNTDRQGYPQHVIEALPGGTAGLGRDLDEAMAQAFDLCLAFDAPMIAHANNSVAGGPGYGGRAEPIHWINALAARPRLRLCLAHQGRFCWKETASPPGVPHGQSSWEWTIGRYVRDNPQSHLYMDISYLSEVLGGGANGYYANQLAAWIKECDREARHIVYGTDWIMLGREQGFETYGKTIVRFLRKDCGLDDARIDRIMAGNALRFLGLDSGPTRERILSWKGGPTPTWATIRVS